MAHAVAFDKIVGNEALRTRLATEIRSGKLSHAYIIEGAAGTGKHTLARQIAAALSCTEPEAGLPCGKCLNCHKILANTSPDVITVGKGEKAGIGVDDIRFLRSDVVVRPNDTDTKVYIIENADTMTVQAQNALLLTLEEPPAYVLFLLLCENAGMLLETIRSRAALLRLRPVQEKLVRDRLTAENTGFGQLSEDAQREILLIAGGSIGRALELCDPKLREPIHEGRRMAAAYVRGRLQKADSATLLGLTASFGKKREEIVAVLDGVLLALRDLILLRQTENAPLLFYTDREEALLLSESRGTVPLLRLTETVEASRKRLLANANVQLELTALALDGKR